jgi:hypothetical protein
VAEPVVASPEYNHPERNVPNNWIEALRKKIPKDSWMRRRFDALACPVAEPTEFRKSEEALAAELTPQTGDDAERLARANAILQQAQNIYDEAQMRAAGATTRATSLQEAVGVAATLLITGAGLIVGQSALQGFVWVLLFAIFLSGATLSLVMCGLRALGAASTIHQWSTPAAEDILDHSRLPEAEARVKLAASLLYCYGFNSKIAAWKISYLGASAWWYRIALAFIVSIAMLVGIYAVAQANHATTSNPAVAASTTVATITTASTSTSTRTCVVPSKTTTAPSSSAASTSC